MCGVARVLRFQDGKVRQDHVDGIVSEVVVRSGLQATVQGWVKREKGDGERERHSCDKHLFTDT